MSAQQPENDAVNSLWANAEVVTISTSATLDINAWKKAWNKQFGGPAPGLKEACLAWASNGDNDRFLLEGGKMLEIALGNHFELRQLPLDEKELSEKLEEVQSETPFEEKEEVFGDHVVRVAEFMDRMSDESQKIPQGTILTEENTGVEEFDELRVLRIKLMLEEFLETVTEMGAWIYAQEQGALTEENTHVGLSSGHFDLQGFADGLADLSVVTVGTMLAFGIDPGPLLKGVDESNLRKFAPGHQFREDGKLIKPLDWQEPDWDSIIQPYRPTPIRNNN